ncbi:DUF2336 domain-containing protein [Ancylobacter sp. G4_0304]|uniref:DUF2336 domain-containing protein n=1 Tax=Ancylobacter sp. G4_0304 TaxID=3114289 RepID=UPI0039C74F0F
MIVRQFLLWARTAPDEVRAQAASALARAYLRADLGARDRAELEEALPLMIADPAPQMALALAEALCRHPLVPADIVLSLAVTEGDAGLMMLARSPVLHERELIELVETGSPARQAAIASREGLAAPVAAAIAEVGHAAACLTLVTNTDADIPGFALARIVARFCHLPAMREALLARPGLPAAAHHALIRAVAGALTAFVSERDWMGTADAARVAREACERATLTCVDGREDADVRGLVEEMFENGQLTPALVLRALLSGQVRLFLEAVSVLSGLPTDRVAALAADRSGAAFRVLYDRIGLPRGAYVAFRTALQVMQAESYVDEGASGLKRRIVERVLDQYAGLGETQGSGKLIEVLQRWQAEAIRDAA